MLVRPVAADVGNRAETQLAGLEGVGQLMVHILEAGRAQAQVPENF